MSSYSNDESMAANCGCIVGAIIIIVILALIRRFLLTPGGWGF
jgi:hypothetical protein